MENNEGLTPEELEASRERGKKILLERAKKHYGVEEFPDKGTIGTFLQGAGEGLVDDLPLTILRALRHGDVGTEKGWFGQLLDEGIREQISDQSKRVPPKGVIEGSEWDRSFYEGGKNLPTSFGVPLTGAVVGGAVGGQPGAVVGAGALSYPVFYYSAKDAFVEDIYNLVGKRMKPEKWEQYRDLIEESAQTAATAEGGFEAASSMLEAAVGLVPIAKFIPKKLIKNAIGRFILGASGKVATTAGIEIPSEMGTELVQSNEMAKYTGETPITPYEAAKRVGGPTAVASLVGAGGYSLAGKMSKRRGNEQDDSNAPPDIDDSNVPPDIDDSNAPPRNVPPPESETDANTTYPEADYFDVKRTKNGISEIDTQLSQIEKEFYDNPDNADKSVKVLPGYQSLLQKRSALERSLTRKYGSADLSELSDDDVIELEAANFDSMTVSKSPFQSRPLSDANRYADPLFVEPSMPGPVAPIFPSNERKAEPPPVNTAPIITPEQQQEIDSRSYLQRSQERLERILSTDDANEIDSILKENAAEPIRDIEITSRLMDVATSKKKPKTWQEIKQDQLQGEPLTTSPLDIPPADKPWAATSQNNIVDEQVKDDSAESEDAPLSEKKRLEGIQQPSDTQAGQQPPQDDSEVIANTRAQSAFAEKDKQKADENTQIGAEQPILNPTAKDNMDLADLNNFDRIMEIRKRFPDLGAHDQVKLSRQIREESSGTRGSMRTDKTDFELKEEQRLLREKRGMAPEKPEKKHQLSEPDYTPSPDAVEAYKEKKQAFEGGKIVDNIEANRIQIVFDEKPSEQKRKELKGNGFKWAPFNNAWQNYRSRYNMDAAKRIAGVRESPQEKYSTTKTPSKNVPTETIKRIQSILSDAIKKGAVAVGLSPDGSIWIRSKNGHGVNIKDVNQISGNQIAFELGRGRMQQDGEIIAGSYEGDTIQITRGVGDTFTVAHETSHWLETVGALTPLDIATIKAKIKQLHAKGQWQAENKNDIGGPEDRANWLAQQLTMKDPTGLKGIVQKIKAFIDKIFNAFTRTAEGVARDIKSGKVFDMPESIQNHPLKDEIQYATKKINNGAVTMTPSGMAAAAQQAIGTLQERFGKGYQDNDLKVLSRLSGVPILLGKKFKSIGKGVWIEIRGQERREKFLHKQWDDGGLYASMNETKSKAEAEELQGLIWQYNNHKMQGVSESWFAVSNNGQSISLNPLHYEQMEAKLRADGVSPAVVSAYVNIRKSLDGIFIDYHEMLSQNDTIDQNDIQKYRQSLNKINNFFPQMREGDSFTIIKNDKGHTIWREHYDSTFIGRAKGEHLKSKERAEKYAAENGLQKYTIDQGKVEAVPDEAFFNIDTNNMQQVIDAAIQKVTNNKVVGNALSKAVADVLKGRGWSRHTINRKNTPGFKKDDIWGSLHDYLAGYAGFKTKIERAVEHHDNLKTVDSKQNPSEYSYLHKYVKDMLANQDGLDKAVDKVRGVMFVKYLGFNLKSALVNLTQNIVLGAPILSKYTSGAFESERLLSKAMIDVKKALISKGATYAHLSQAEQSAIKEMHESGSTIDRFLRDLQGDLPNAGWSKYAKKAIEWSGFFMGMAERFNRTSMGLAAYRIGMEKFRGQYAGGALQNKAVEFAKELILDAHFLPGKMNLPEIFRGGAPQKVMRTAYTFRTFTHNYLHTLADLMLNQGPEGRKVFARSMRNLVAVGGLTAIPFFKVFADAFDGGDDDDLETKIRNIAPDKWMKDLLIYGLPGVAGADLSGSMRIDIPRSLEDIIGVPYSVQKDSINFVKSFKSGSKYRMLTDFPLTPMFIRNPMRGIELYSRGQTTRGGRDINYPGEQGPRKISGGETIGKAIGFQPTSVSKAFSSYKATEKVKTAIMEKKARWADQYVNAIRDKDNEKAKEILAEISEHNKKALSEKKFYKVVNVKQMIRNRLRTGGFPGIPKNMRMKALNIANQWK